MRARVFVGIWRVCMYVHMQGCSVCACACVYTWMRAPIIITDGEDRGHVGSSIAVQPGDLITSAIDYAADERNQYSYTLRIWANSDEAAASTVTVTKPFMGIHEEYASDYGTTRDSNYYNWINRNHFSVRCRWETWHLLDQAQYPVQFKWDLNLTVAQPTLDAPCMTSKDAPCVFPFFFGDVEYNECTTADGSSQPWCFVARPDGPDFGFCEPSCPGGPPANLPVDLSFSAASPDGMYSYVSRQKRRGDVMTVQGYTARRVAPISWLLDTAEQSCWSPEAFARVDLGSGITIAACADRVASNPCCGIAFEFDSAGSWCSCGAAGTSNEMCRGNSDYVATSSIYRVQVGSSFRPSKSPTAVPTRNPTPWSYLSTPSPTVVLSASPTVLPTAAPISIGLATEAPVLSTARRLCTGTALILAVSAMVLV